MSAKRDGKDETGSGDDRGAVRPAALAAAVREGFVELTGMTPEAVSSLSRNGDDGWTLHLEVVEVPRVPDTTSLLATYEVGTDSGGSVTGYRRIRRYERGRPDPA